MDELSDFDDYALSDILTNPLGTASIPPPSRQFTEATPTREAAATQDAARAEFRRRGYSDDEIDLLEHRDYSPIQQRRETLE